MCAVRRTFIGGLVSVFVVLRYFVNSMCLHRDLSLPPPHLATDLISAQIRNSDRSLVLEKGKTQAGTVRAVERYAILKRVVKCGFLTDSQAVTQIMPLDRVFGQSVSRLHLIGDMWLFYLGYSIGKLKLLGTLLLYVFISSMATETYIIKLLSFFHTLPPYWTSSSHYTGCFTTCGHYCRRWFPRSLWPKKFI